MKSVVGVEMEVRQDLGFFSSSVWVFRGKRPALLGIGYRGGWRSGCIRSGFRLLVVGLCFGFSFAFFSCCLFCCAQGRRRCVWLVWVCLLWYIETRSIYVQSGEWSFAVACMHFLESRAWRAHTAISKEAGHQFPVSNRSWRINPSPRSLPS